MIAQTVQPSSRFELRLSKGIRALELQRHEDALELFKQAQALEFFRPEPWFWMGRAYEEIGDLKAAGYSYQLACDLGRNFKAARQGLRRLGFLGIRDAV